MKENSKPCGKKPLVDAKPISIPMVSSTPSLPAVTNAATLEGIREIVAVAGGGESSPSTSTSLSPTRSSVSVTAAVVIGSTKTITKSQIEGVALRPGLVSRGTQTGTGSNMPDDLQEKRRLIRKQLAVLLHAVLCRVRDELIGNTGETARECPTAFCGLMKNVLTHLRTCTARQNCTQPHCLSSRQILDHWKSCTQPDCQVCSSLRRVVPAYLNAVVTNPRWREEIMTRFQWLITFIGPISMNTSPSFQLPFGTQPRATGRSQMENEGEEASPNNPPPPRNLCCAAEE